MSEAETQKLKDSITDDEAAKKIIEIISNSKEGVLNPSINFAENKINYPQVLNGDVTTSNEFPNVVVTVNRYSLLLLK